MTSARREQLIAGLRTKEDRDFFFEEEIDTGLPYQIRALRRDREWTQEELAQRLGLTQEGVSRLENPNYGKFTLSTLKRVASAFDVALVVRFERFSKLVDWVATLSPEDLAVPDFQHDPELVTDIHRTESTRTAEPRPSEVSPTIPPHSELESRNPAEQRHLQEIGHRIAALRDVLTATPEPDGDAAALDWFCYLERIKSVVGNAGNDLAFVTALMAKNFLCRRFRMLPFDVAEKPQGAPGLDIDAVTLDGQRVIGEIKATIPYKGTRLGAAQEREFRKDFAKLNREVADHKFFFVADAAAFDIVRERYAGEIPDVVVVLLATGQEFACPSPSVSVAALPGRRSTSNGGSPEAQ